MSAHRYPPGASAALRAEIDREWAEEPLCEITHELRARESIAVITDAGERAATAHDRVTRLEDDRAKYKAEAIQRLMQTQNPLTGKLHSASSAEAVVETDELYASYRMMQREAEVERWRSLAAFSAAKLIARLNVALVEAQGRDA
jgi:hypothetical protein